MIRAANLSHLFHTTRGAFRLDLGSDGNRNRLASPRLITAVGRTGSGFRIWVAIFVTAATAISRCIGLSLAAA